MAKRIAIKHENTIRSLILLSSMVIGLISVTLSQTVPTHSTKSSKNDFVQQQRRLQGMGLMDAQEISNDYIDIALDELGRFTVGTLEGDPTIASDNEKALLFGHPFPGTSETMIEIDGSTYSIHGIPGTIIAGDDTMSITLSVGDIEILEKLTIVNSPSTGNKDTVEISFRLRNTGAVSHDVKLRTQLDTLLGDNDGAPFRIAEVGEVTTDTEFDTDPASPAQDVPVSSLVLDNLSNPQIISLLTFRYLTYTVPDRVVLGWWPASMSEFDYAIVPGRSFLDNNGDGIINGYSSDSDSSVIVYWGYFTPFSLAAGETRTFAISYGLGDCTVRTGHPVSMLICSPQKMEGIVSGGTYAYFPNPFPVSAFFSDTSGTGISGVAVLGMSPGLQFAGTDVAQKSLLIPSNDSTQIDWILSANARYTGARMFGVSYSAGGRSDTATRSVQVLPIPNAVYGQATDPNGLPIAGGTITVYRGSAVIGAITTQADGRYAIDGLEPGRYEVRLSVAGSPDSYFPAYVVSSTSDSGASGNPSDFTGESEAAFAYPNPAYDREVRISYHTNGPASVTIDIYSERGKLIDSVSDSAPGSGWHVATWPLDRVANGVYIFLVDAGGTKTKGKFAVLKRQGL